MGELVQGRENTMIRTLRQPVSNAHGIRNRACDAAITVATAVIDAFVERRWSPADPNAQELHALAHQIMTVLDDLPPVGAADVVDDTVAWVAEAAHVLIMQARASASRGQALIWCDDDTRLVDTRIEDMLLPAYSLLITAK